jgi:hypothetical protein
MPMIDDQKVVSLLTPILNDFRTSVSNEIAQKLAEKMPEIDDQKLATLAAPSPIDYDEICKKMTPIFEAKIREMHSLASEQKARENVLWTPSRQGRKTEKIYDQFGQVLTDQPGEKSTDPALKIVQRSQTPQPLSSSENVQKSPGSEERKLIGLTYQEVIKLLPCQRKNIKISDIKTAVRRGDLKEKSDGSLAKSAVENWAKTFRPVGKVS